MRGWIRIGRQCATRQDLFPDWPFNNATVLHHPRQLLEYVDPIERVDRRGDEIRRQSGPYRAALLVNAQETRRVNGHRLQDGGQAVEGVFLPQGGPMNRRVFLRIIWVVFVVAVPTLTFAQAEQRIPLAVRIPREFAELRGTWVLDESAGKGHIVGLPVAHMLVVSTTPFEISLVKDARDPEIYALGGSESVAKDPRTGALLDIRYNFTLVAGMVALTSKRARGAFTNIITDAYSTAGDVLTVERQLSVLAQPPGNLVTLSDESNNRQTLVYRRNK
jgi:hypothetical protein